MTHDAISCERPRAHRPFSLRSLLNGNGDRRQAENGASSRDERVDTPQSSLKHGNWPTKAAMLRMRIVSQNPHSPLDLTTGKKALTTSAGRL
jgi:hypothetical protein